jgi:hypothetical protein
MDFRRNCGDAAYSHLGLISMNIDLAIGNKYNRSAPFESERQDSKTDFSLVLLIQFELIDANIVQRLCVVVTEDYRLRCRA